MSMKIELFWNGQMLGQEEHVRSHASFDMPFSEKNGEITLDFKVLSRKKNQRWPCSVVLNVPYFGPWHYIRSQSFLSEFAKISHATNVKEIRWRRSSFLTSIHPSISISEADYLLNTTTESAVCKLPVTVPILKECCTSIKVQWQWALGSVMKRTWKAPHKLDAFLFSVWYFTKDMG